MIVQFMGSDSAMVALFGPVAMAAVTALLTPMSHHNLLIYRPGGYRLADDAVVGAPLTAAFAIVVALIAPLLWPG